MTRILPGFRGSLAVACLAVLAAPTVAQCTFEAEATGLPTVSLAVDVLGLGAANLPLSTVLPIGGAGCNLLVTADSLQLLLMANSAVTTSLPIPNTQSLVGFQVNQQVVAFELGAGGSVVDMTSSNALQLTVGAL